MSVSKEELNVRNNWLKYHIPGQSEYYRVKRNAIFINSHNTILHELWKCLICLMLNKYGDFKVTDDLKKSMISISKLIELTMKEFTPTKHSFITECVPTLEPDRRIDVVDLSNNNRIEIESNTKEKKDNSLTVYIK